MATNTRNSVVAIGFIVMLFAAAVGIYKGFSQPTIITPDTPAPVIEWSDTAEEAVRKEQTLQAIILEVEREQVRLLKQILQILEQQNPPSREALDLMRSIDAESPR